jgi:hypothetical protein
VKSHKKLNINLNKIQLEDLAQLTHIIEEEIVKYLNEVLALRLTDCNVTIGAEVKEEELVVSIDVEVKAYFSNSVNLEAVVDSALRRAFDAVERFLTRYRTSNKHDTTSSKNNNYNPC